MSYAHTNKNEKAHILGAYNFFKNAVPMDADYCVCIGSAAMDITGYPENTFKLHDSNPGKIYLATGGVSNNIAHNLARLRIKTKLMSCIGDDLMGESILREGEAAGVEMSCVKQLKGSTSPIYLALLDEQRNMHAAIAHMDTLNTITPTYLETHRNIILGAKVILFDASIPEETIAYICESFGHIPLFVDPVSTVKGLRLKKHLRGIHTIKPNIYEAAEISGVELSDPNCCEKAADWFLEQGVKYVYISLGKDGVLAASESVRYHANVFHPNHIASLSGAGDAFMAGLVFAKMLGANLQNATYFALGMSALTIQILSTVNKHICTDKVLKIMYQNL